MEHTTRIELENLKDLHAVELGVLESKKVRRLTIEDALVDTGATGLCLPNHSLNNSDSRRSEISGCKLQTIPQNAPFIPK